MSPTTRPTPRARAPRHSSARPARRRSRELALQGLYQWLLAGHPVETIAAQLRESEDFDKADAEHFDALLNGCVDEAASLDAVIARAADRATTALSPVEHSVLLIGAWELSRCIEIPYRVVINEAVELAKSFGGTDGHRYVNGVLDKVAGELRPIEVAQRAAAR